jgi:hypothetical protein
MGIFDFSFRKQVQDTQPPSDPYQSIAEGVIDICGDRYEKALLYAEVEDGVISADIFFQQANQNKVKFLFASEALRDCIYEFWSVGEGSIAPKSWATMVFVIENGGFSTDLTYPDQLNRNEDLTDRRPRVLAKHFAGREVDYSKPNG